MPETPSADAIVGDFFADLSSGLAKVIVGKARAVLDKATAERSGIFPPNVPPIQASAQAGHAPPYDPFGQAQAPPKPAERDPYALLGAARGLPLDVYESFFRAQSKHAHPDKNAGSDARMKDLTWAIAKIRKELRQS